MTRLSVWFSCFRETCRTLVLPCGFWVSTWSHQLSHEYFHTLVHFTGSFDVLVYFLNVRLRCTQDAGKANTPIQLLWDGTGEMAELIKARLMIQRQQLLWEAFMFRSGECSLIAKMLHSTQLSLSPSPARSHVQLSLFLWVWPLSIRIKLCRSFLPLYLQYLEILFEISPPFKLHSQIWEQEHLLVLWISQAHSNIFFLVMQFYIINKYWAEYFKGILKSSEFPAACGKG